MDESFEVKFNSFDPDTNPTRNFEKTCKPNSKFEADGIGDETPEKFSRSDAFVLRHQQA